MMTMGISSRSWFLNINEVSQAKHTESLLRIADDALKIVKNVCHLHLQYLKSSSLTSVKLPGAAFQLNILKHSRRSTMHDQLSHVVSHCVAFVHC